MTEFIFDKGKKEEGDKECWKLTKSKRIFLSFMEDNF